MLALSPLSLTDLRLNHVAGRQLAPEQLAAALPGTEAASMAAAAQQLAAGLRRCEAGCGAVSSLRVLALLQERLGANSQVRKLLTTRAILFS